MNTDWFFELDLMLAALILLIQCAAMLHILITKHDNPSQASFWLLLVTLLPVMWKVLYMWQ